MPTEITVTGCVNCPMSSWGHRGTYCTLQIERSPDSDKNLMRTCPLKPDSITIKLKQDETHKTDVRGGESEW